MAPLTSAERSQVQILLGPWLVGACLVLLLQGVVLCQFVTYYSHYTDDNRGLRIAAAFLALLTVLKSIHEFSLTWIQYIDHFGDFEGALMVGWLQSYNPLLVALIASYVQSYFLFRLWVISKKWYIVAPVAAVCIFALVSVIIGTYYLSILDASNSKWFSVHSMWLAVHFGATFAADILLSLTTAYFLLKSKKDVLPQTAGLLNALIRLTFQTAAPGALCAMLTLIFSRTATQTISVVFHMPIPMMYAISMMWTLNARRAIRAIHSSRNGMPTSSNEISGGRSRTRRAGDIELGAIQVHKETDTTQHIDVRDMFHSADAKRGQVQSQGKGDDGSVQDSM